VRFNRAIINPKWDSYYNYSNLHRLHILFGEANMSEYAAKLKVGTTCLVLDLIEESAVPKAVRLADPVKTLKSISRDPTWEWLAVRADGSTIPAVELQRLYLEAAKRRLKGKNEQTDWVLREWEYVLAGLELDPMVLADRLDWVAKRKLLTLFMEAEGVGWHDDVLQSLDMEYHNINPCTSLYYGLVEDGQIQRITSDEAIDEAMCEAPSNTRAFGRSRVIKRLIEGKKKGYVIDWDSVYVDRDRYLELKNPFHSYRKEAANFAKRI
jgi:proteasome accessory factor A